MIEYLIPQSPDGRILKKAADLLAEGSLVAFPTDTNWVVACDPYSKKGVEALYRFKGETKSHHFSLLCDGISSASELANISDAAFRMINRRVPGHYTFIFEAKKSITKALKASKIDHQVGLRFVPSKIVTKLIELFGKPLITTNILTSQLGLSEGEDVYGYLVEEVLSHQIGLILDPGEYEFVGPSTVIDFTVDGQPEVIREGAGEVFV
jgi:tRNA threonylcarbamoyl adenosine modification protein (Sua5/YciO/YrdC/YwlC family)